MLHVAGQRMFAPGVVSQSEADSDEQYLLQRKSEHASKDRVRVFNVQVDVIVVHVGHLHTPMN